MSKTGVVYVANEDDLDNVVNVLKDINRNVVCKRSTVGILDDGHVNTVVCLKKDSKGKIVTRLAIVKATINSDITSAIKGKLSTLKDFIGD